jgi:hypothetical protein
MQLIELHRPMAFQRFLLRDCRAIREGRQNYLSESDIKALGGFLRGFPKTRHMFQT